MSRIHSHRLDNGVCLVAEEVPGAQSLAMNVLLPAGVICEPVGKQGVATILSEMICRGAGDLDSRAHSDALDRLGIQRGTSVDSVHLRINATMIGSKVGKALPLILDMVRCPRLDREALEPTRDLALQDLEALEDEPQQKAFVRLREHHYPRPFNRNPMGEREHLEAMKAGDVKSYWKKMFVPEGTILSFAGRFDFEEIKALVGRHLEDWRGRSEATGPGDRDAGGYRHEHADSTQMHIGVAYDGVLETDNDSVLQRAATAVLSGGMSGRLFTEVRERHGLCYSVFASYAASRHLGVILSYAGTTAPRAQQTLDILIAELRRLSDGITEAEFQRAVVGMKSRLVMQGESTGARAGAIAFDQYTYGRPRSLDELTRRIDAVTLDRVNAFVASHRPGAMTVVTIGPNALVV